MKQRNFTKKQKRSLVKQYKALMVGDIPVIGRYDPILVGEPFSDILQEYQ